jgi:hypothetical protein
LSYARNRSSINANWPTIKSYVATILEQRSLCSAPTGTRQQRDR